MKRLALLASVVVALLGAAAARPNVAAAHPLGNFTVNHYAGIELAGNQRVRPVRPRPRGDPDAPVRGRGARAGLRRGGRPSARAAGSGSSACRSSSVRASGDRARRRRGPHDASLRGDLRRLRPGRRAHVRRTRRSRTGSAGERSRSNARDGARRDLELRPLAEPRRTSSASTRRSFSRRRSTCGPRTCASRLAIDAVAPPGLRAAVAPAHTRRRVRGADRPRRPVARRDPRLVARRCVLGRRPCAHTRPRQGARRRVPRGNAGPPAPCVRPRGDGDRHAHDRRVRARSGHACCSRSSSSPSSSTRG